VKKFWDRIGGAIAILMTIIYVLLIANQIFNFISNVYLLKILGEAITFGGIALVIVVTFEMTTKWPFLLKLVVFASWVMIIIYAISPTFFGLLA
jgi:hypothetical protein